MVVATFDDASFYFFGKHGLQRFERPTLHNPMSARRTHAIQIALNLYHICGGVRGLTLHLCNLVCNVVSNKMLEIDLDVVATKSCKKDCFTRVFFLCLHVSSVAFRFIYYWRNFRSGY